LRDEWGFEAYYNAAITPWLLLTPDVQVIGPAQKKKIANRRLIETGTVLGVRVVERSIFLFTILAGAEWTA
jgi:carbohydrate-selective porin OprB